ncbi:putative toxin-antitoxin system toxin component, PIN family [Algoriphagus hitonicola]|uniref:PIN domain-containing protein n=1 Tax=Algoriphagus hitonicola TaxID=435880 RepID=A0A1I2UV60_9BACT|nr:PIN domain-containing protein [Algoriphagus hitonicola]
MKVVLDTNILISALISKSYPSKILEAIFKTPSIELCLSEEIFREYAEVLARPKFSRFNDFYHHALIVLHQIKRIAVFYNPKRSVDILEDKSDNKFLELCLECKANILVTGNFNDFNISKFRNTQILSPKEFYLKLSN